MTITENHRQRNITEKYKFLHKNIIVLSYLPEDYAASPHQWLGMNTAFNNCHVVWCMLVWVSGSGIIVENGQCKQFYKHLLGLLKRANYTKQYKHNTEKSSSHLHRFHEATCFVCGAERRNFVLFMQSARIQVFQSHFIAEFVLILKNQKKTTK